MKFVLILLILCLTLTTAFAQTDDRKGEDSALTLQNDEAVIYFAGGCFWGIEELMRLVPGVTDATSGYANGTTESPTYREVTTGKTGHRETVRVVYRPADVSLQALLSLFFSTIDPTVENRQGNDVGKQYQTGVYYVGETDAGIVRAAAERERARQEKFVVEIAPLTSFYPAESEHQDYLERNPGGYCHIGADAFDRARGLTANSEHPSAAEYRSIAPALAKAWLDDGRPLRLMDVRTKAEYDGGRIPGAELLPVEAIGADMPDMLTNLHETILVYCRSGRRSRDAANKLVAMGYTAVYDLGGINDWGYETVKTE